MESAGLVVVKSNAQLDQEENQRLQAEREAEEGLNTDVTTSLAQHIREFWEVARRHKEPIEKQMLQSVRQLAGRYSDSKAQEISEQGLPLIYMQITSVKSRAAKSWIRDVLMPAGDKPWSLKQTAEPELPETAKTNIMGRVRHDAMQFMMATGQQVTQQQIEQVAEKLQDQMREMLKEEGEKRIGRMSSVIEDQLQEGDWETQFNDVISDIVDYPAGILKGPVLRKDRQMRWNSQTGRIEVVDEIKMEVERVDPFCFYPAPGVTHPDEGDCIQLHEYAPADIHNLIGLPGYDEEAIRAVLNEHSAHGLSNWSRESLKSSLYRARGHTTGSSSEEKKIESLEYWGAVQGKKLIEWGKSEAEITDPEKMYDIMAELIGRHVICVRLNPNPLGNKVYSKACFEDVPGSFWGQGVPDLIRDCQDVCNAAARSLVANMGISSGPQVAINTGSLPPGTDIEQMYPWKIWQLDFTKMQQGSRPPIEFFQPNSNTDQLMKVFKEFSSLADEYSGIPAYSYGVGDSVGGAGRTASGLSMLMNAASKAIKNVVKHIDSGVISKIVHGYYVYNMLWHPDQSIKGDAKVVARGALSLVAKEQNQLRLQEVLAQTNNPTDMQIIGLEGRAELLRKALQGVDVGSDFIPSEEELTAKMQQRSQELMAQQGAPVQ